MEIIDGNFRAYECTIADYDKILGIYRSHLYIQGSPRTLKSDERFENHLAEVLLGNKSEHCFIGVEDTKTRNLVSYVNYVFPANSNFCFMKLGGTTPKALSLPTYKDTGVIPLLRLGVALSESKNYFDTFWTFKLNSYLPFCKVLNDYEQKSNVEQRVQWLLHKIVYPQDQLTTSIEKFLLEGGLVERKYPVAIIHSTLKQEFRLEHFKKNFNLTEETLRKCTIPGYGRSTSTTTPSPTNS